LILLRRPDVLHQIDQLPAERQSFHHPTDHRTWLHRFFDRPALRMLPRSLTLALLVDLMLLFQKASVRVLFLQRFLIRIHLQGDHWTTQAQYLKFHFQVLPEYFLMILNPDRFPFIHFWLPLRVRMLHFRLSAEIEISLSQFVDFTLILIQSQGKWCCTKQAV
jgi:hypothetical protein